MEEKVDQITSKMRHDHKILLMKRANLQGLVRELEQSNVALMSEQGESDDIKRANEAEYASFGKGKIGGNVAS